jgi:predicted acetyltransferase
MNTIMADEYPIRPVGDADYDAYRRVHHHAFNGGATAPERAARSRRQFEADRSLAAFDPALPDGESVIGTAGAYSLQMAVPGAVLPVAGVTAVSVLPSHRRRGVLAPADPALRLRLAEPQAVTAELAKVYKTVLPGQPGFYARSEDWWGRVLHDPPAERRGFGPLRCLLAEDASGVRGYALYAAAERWDDPTGLPDGQLTVRELLGADPAASAALWHDLLTRDLVTAVTAEYRPADDPLIYQLADQRRARVRVTDGLWIRIIDLPAALAARRYAAPVDVVLEVTDSLIGGNEGRWRLRADGGPGGGTACQRTGSPADLALDVRELGAVYLGGTRLGTLAAAGLARELRPGMLGPLSAALTWDPAPWCPWVF